MSEPQTLGEGFRSLAGDPDDEWYSAIPNDCDNCGMFTKGWRWFKSGTSKLTCICYKCGGKEVPHE